jgi:Meiotically up-regulated gene 113
MERERMTTEVMEAFEIGDDFDFIREHGIKTAKHRLFFQKENLTIQFNEIYDGDTEFNIYEIDLEKIETKDDLFYWVTHLHSKEWARHGEIYAFLTLFDMACFECLGGYYEDFMNTNTPFSFGVKGGVYVIEAVGTNRVKIGYSLNPEKRIKELSTGCPFELQLVGCVKGTIEREKQLHCRFTKYRVNGEWFELKGKLSQWISETFQRNNA